MQDMTNAKLILLILHENQTDYDRIKKGSLSMMNDITTEKIKNNIMMLYTTQVKIL